MRECGVGDDDRFSPRRCHDDVSMSCLSFSTKRPAILRTSNRSPRFPHPGNAEAWATINSFVCGRPNAFPRRPLPATIRRQEQKKNSAVLTMSRRFPGWAGLETQVIRSKWRRDRRALDR